ncbi:MAG: hypothetical protein J7621_12185 [Niastella sp.]|nr:hypothetical protein [Niastella sp.]
MSYPKIVAFFLSILAINSIYAQTDCNCKGSLEKLFLKIETEYPGFEEKVKHDKGFYDSKKEILLNKSNSVTNDSCIAVLQDYISFFKDEHIFLQLRARETNKQEVAPTKNKPAEKEIDSKIINGNIFYLRLSSFQYANVIPLQELVKHNKKSIEQCKGMIIDIRGNGGGTDDVYQPLLPYILTNPLRIMSVEFFSTHTLIDGLRDYAIQQIKTDSLNEIRKIDSGLQEYRDNMGKFVLYGDSKVIIDSIKISKRGPSQVIILSDRRVASAGENFLFSARQSKKVKIMGTPSMGALDYGSIREFKFGCDNYELYLPTYRSTRLPNYPVDNIGIQPDIYLDESIKDWIEFAVKYINE